MGYQGNQVMQGRRVLRETREFLAILVRGDPLDLRDPLARKEKQVHQASLGHTGSEVIPGRLGLRDRQADVALQEPMVHRVTLDLVDSREPLVLQDLQEQRVPLVLLVPEVFLVALATPVCLEL